MMLLSHDRSYRKPASAHLVDQVCPVEQEVFPAEQEVFPAELVVSDDPWTDGGCPGETICGSASPARCRLRSPYRAGVTSGAIWTLRCHLASPAKMTPPLKRQSTQNSQVRVFFFNLVFFVSVGNCLKCNETRN